MVQIIYMRAMEIISHAEVEAVAKRVGLTLTGLCREAGVDRSVLHRWKAGKGTPTIRTLNRLLEAAAAFQCKKNGHGDDAEAAPPTDL